MKKISVPILIFLFAFSVLSFTTEKTEPIVAPQTTATSINWLSWENAMALYKTEKKKFLVNIYTDHCGWCQHMDRTTYNQEHLAKYINANYYAIKLNAEQRESIEFNNKVYKYVKSGNVGYHELAASITMGGLGTPALVFIDEKLEVIQPMLGYKDPDNFEVIITYFGENQYLATPWDVYQANYQPMSRPKLISDD